ncbi:MAG: histidinol dehydrogenase [Burkholderiales bacterium]
MTGLIRRLDASHARFTEELASLLDRESAGDAAIEAAVQGILADVRARGDAAVLEATARFDDVRATTIAELTISGAEIAAALQSIGAAERDALQAAAERIRTFHERQCAPGLRYRETDGTELGWQVTPLDRVGLYVPGGKAAYPSSLLMNAIPARVAGVRELVMVSPTPRGERNPLVLAAAAIAGVDTIYTIGGAQAVGALAYGTASIAPVDKIVGPGNAYVAEAKRRVFGKVGIDMIAGPSEILVIADGSTDPDWIALDLFSQAEHDEMAQAILISPDTAYLDRVQASIARLIDTLPRRQIIAASLAGRGALILSRNLAHACEIANFIAAEHLELSVADPEALLPLIRHAGAIFLGAHSSESLGDYCAGPNHVLPTSRTARFSSPLGVYDFQKRSSLIKVSRQGATVLGRIASTLAHGEGLDAHARAAEVRL